MTKCGFVPMLDYWLNTNTVHPRYSLPTLCEHIRTIEYIMYSPSVLTIYLSQSDVFGSSSSFDYYDLLPTDNLSLVGTGHSISY